MSFFLYLYFIDDNLTRCIQFKQECLVPSIGALLPYVNNHEEVELLNHHQDYQILTRFGATNFIRVNLTVFKTYKTELNWSVTIFLK